MTYDKQDEKEMQKREEKGTNDALNSIIGAAFLIWIGVLLLANNMGFMNVFTDILDSLSIPAYDWYWDPPFISTRGLQVFFLGAGMLLLLEIVLRLIIPTFRRQVFGTFIGVAVFFGLALGNWDLVWPIVVIAAGVAMLLSGLIRRR